METEAIPNKRFQFHDMDVTVHRRTFARDVAFGLTAPQKWLPPKYFYDERGSQLYEQICGLPEYYLYRAELEILGTYAAEIHTEIGHLALVELDRKSTRLNSSHPSISYAVFCLKKKKKKIKIKERSSQLI